MNALLVSVNVLFFILIAIGCKSENPSDLKATPAQKNKLRVCIISTVVETFPEAERNLNAVGLFASDMISKAPTQNENQKDPAFEDYVQNLGCDPSRESGPKNYGLTIVEQWVLSSHNTAPIGPQDSSASENRSLKVGGEK